MLHLTSSRLIIASLLVVALLCSTFGECDAKKKGRGKGKKKGNVANVGGANQLRCGVCLVSVSELRKEMDDTDDGDSIDLRWGLTAEMEDGRPKRIGKVIPYHRSELRSIEVMETLCDGVMKNYTTTEEVPGEVRLKLLPKKERGGNMKKMMDSGAFSPDSPIYKREEKKQAIQAKQQKHCEELLEASEDHIVSLIKAGKTRREFEEALCYGSTAAPCGEARVPCKPGAVNKVSGTTPCFLCPVGSYQDEEGQQACKACPEGHTTPGKGTVDPTGCVLNPPPEGKDDQDSPPGGNDDSEDPPPGGNHEDEQQPPPEGRDEQQVPPEDKAEL
mmetsp:Transcript_51804/g.105448  ORF Transcript_51804/g.105448 Transcript_51804/m.105448 type:complete len:331 (-) Transcript_51804:220-1212(-)